MCTYLTLGGCRPCTLFRDGFSRRRTRNGAEINEQAEDGVNFPGSSVYQFAPGSWEIYRPKTDELELSTESSSTSLSSMSSSSSTSSSGDYWYGAQVLRCNTEDEPLSFFRNTVGPSWLANVFVTFILPEVDDKLEVIFEGNTRVVAKVTRKDATTLTYSLQIGSVTRTIDTSPWPVSQMSGLLVSFFLPSVYPLMATGAKCEISPSSSLDVFLDNHIDDEMRHTEIKLRASSGVAVASLRVFRAVPRCNGLLNEYLVSDSDGYISSQSSTSTSSSSPGGNSSSSASSTSQSSASSVVDSSSSFSSQSVI